ncbi:MAG: BON domain-containing protein [Nocardioides sp.]|nr:BON domain-containing protein [Nocardioides sp.]
MKLIQTAPDINLKRAIEEELRWTLGVDATTIGVSVSDGAVTLSGEVGSFPEKLRAEKAVQRVCGVHGIAQEITVRDSYGAPNDTDIAREAGHALENAVDIAAHAVQATVKDHVVTLSGAVPWGYQREAASRAVRHLKGVRDVHNSVTITPRVSSGDIARAIEAALVRTARVDAHRCTVSATTDGDVTITGTVGSWAERQQIDAVARSGAGVTSVHNKLHVLP